MDTNPLQYAFLQTAKEMENVIGRQYKENYAWAEFQIRKQLKIERPQPLPNNWKYNIPTLLKGFVRDKYFDKLERCKELQNILKNFYNIYREYDSKIDALMQHIEMQQEEMDANYESGQVYLQLLEKTIQQHQLKSTQRA